uniref:Reverse transcriptase zinc-binding domain-containing protein n=1 Tax=Amphimedon queenslandica TaxID=400682 RepID=A0A1X7VKC9_AMPQE
MYGQYYRELSGVADCVNSWAWLQRSDLKSETEALICAAQEQALRTNYIKCKVDKTVESPLCQLCKEAGESVYHIISECKKLAQKEYKRRHDGVARFLHWELCGKYKLQRTEKWWEHQPEGVMEPSDVKILWDVMIQCDHLIEHRKPDIVVLEKGDKKCFIVDVAIPGDKRIISKEEEKVEKYQELNKT